MFELVCQREQRVEPCQVPRLMTESRTAFRLTSNKPRRNPIQSRRLLHQGSEVSARFSGGIPRGEQRCPSDRVYPERWECRPGLIALSGEAG
jgi:hypothetical protein